MSTWEKIIYDLIVRASTDLPEDVEKKLASALNDEEADSNASQTLRTMLENSRLARHGTKPICQDTGNLVFYLTIPDGMLITPLTDAIQSAVEQATADGILRKNIVDPLNEKNTCNNLGPGCPQIHIEQTSVNERSEQIDMSLLLKGGGCENVGIQYSLPDTALGADRNFNGVQKCALDAVYHAQGKGCAPGVLTVCIGGDRASGYAESKRLFLRSLGSVNPIDELAALENNILENANQLGIGPMGLGGKTTLLDVFISCLGRVPASYFVTVSYMCWAYRRQNITLPLT